MYSNKVHKLHLIGYTQNYLILMKKSSIKLISSNIISRMQYAVRQFSLITSTIFKSTSESNYANLEHIHN